MSLVARYPMMPSGGLIVGGVGLGLAVGGLLGHAGLQYGFAAGAVLGFGGVTLAGPAVRARFGRPSRTQVRIMMAGIGAELAVFLALGLFAHGWSFDRLLAAVLVVVSAHFLILAGSHGPLIAGLGVAGLAWLALALMGLHLPIGPVLAGDGLIKLAFGAAMAAPLLSRRGPG